MRFGPTIEGRLAALDSWRWRCLALALATAAATAAGLWLRIPFLLPLLQAAAAWPFFLAPCAAGKPRRAAVAILVFALVAGAVVTAAVANAPRDAFHRAVPNGASYRDEMLAFVQSGGTAGEEATPSLFLPKHALHFVLFVVLCAATCGIGALAMGAALLDYMSYYVGTLAAEASYHGGSPARALLVSWSPYAIVRVLGYASAGAGIVSAMLGPPASRPAARRAIWLGCALVVVDVVAKAFLARWYGETVLSALYPH